jgi:hypothetical protein
MIIDRLFSRPRALGGLLLITLFASGCSPLVFREPATPPPHAFISYEAPKPGNRSLRLAVKDLIDIKGEVTSAGSQYLTSMPNRQRKTRHVCGLHASGR